MPSKLLEIQAPFDLILRPIDRTYSILVQPYHARAITDEGTWYLDLDTGWVTDERSGSDAINWMVPKRGNRLYNAMIAFHDTSWSGWVSRSLSNDLFVRQGFVLSGQVNQRVSNLAGFAVDHFGTYYDLADNLPRPYTTNRDYEHLVLHDK